MIPRHSFVSPWPKQSKKVVGRFTVVARFVYVILFLPRKLFHSSPFTSTNWPYFVQHMPNITFLLVSKRHYKLPNPAKTATHREQFLAHSLTSEISSPGKSVEN